MKIDLLEALLKHATHLIIHIFKILQRNQFSKKILTSTAVIHSDLL